MPSSILTNADHFEFTSLQGEELDLFGAVIGWNDEIKTGVVEKLVVKRSGAIHQWVGAPPKRFDFRCVFQGADVRARYNRIVDVVLQQPEGLLVHPRFGRMRAVCEGLGAAETPGDARDTIEFSIKFVETGLKDAPQPSPSAKAASAQSTVATLSTQTVSLLPAEFQAGTIGLSLSSSASLVTARATGFLVAMQAAESGLGTLLDVDASLAALVDSIDAMAALPGCPKGTRSTSALALSYALQSRNRFMAGHPPLIEYILQTPESLGGLAQRLYGSRGKDEKALMLRLNRVARPYLMPVGQKLLLSAPSVMVAL
jgi:hypothetical protein